MSVAGEWYQGRGEGQYDSEVVVRAWNSRSVLAELERGQYPVILLKAE